MALTPAIIKQLRNLYGSTLKIDENSAEYWMNKHRFAVIFSQITSKKSLLLIDSPLQEQAIFDVYGMPSTDINLDMTEEETIAVLVRYQVRLQEAFKEDYAPAATRLYEAVIESYHLQEDENPVINYAHIAEISRASGLTDVEYISFAKFNIPATAVGTIPEEWLKSLGRGL